MVKWQNSVGEFIKQTGTMAIVERIDGVRLRIPLSLIRHATEQDILRALRCK